MEDRNRLLYEDGRVNMEEYRKLPVRDKRNLQGKAEVVIGEDTRAEVTDASIPPYCAVVRLILTFQGMVYRGTGFLIEQNVMITAGHNVYDSKLGGMAEKIEVVEDGAYYQALKWTVSETYKRTSGDDCDWAVVKVAVTPGKHRNTLKWKNIEKEPLDTAGKNVKISGYPREVRAVSTYSQFEADGPIEQHNRQNQTIIHKISTSGGNSGSPVLFMDGGEYYAVGIHVSGDATSNTAKAIDQNVADEIAKL
ncbi:MAG TPA: trypsin-like serine protease [Candidatus Pelethocola excrementipullorum]|nr:trypsin-like serine protease [Candidatus Pelethocola excrementipullorum]